MISDVQKQFLEKVTKNGKIISTRLNERYFENLGIVEIWKRFNEETENLLGSLRDKLTLIKNGYSDYPRCVVCEKPVTITSGKISKYCSKECALKDPERKKKISETKKKSDCTSSNEKRRKTMIEKYGVEYNSQRKDIHNIWTNSRVPDTARVLLEDYDWMFNEYEANKKSAVEIGKELNVDFSTVLRFLRFHGFEIRQNGYNRSLFEKEVVSFLSSLGIEDIKTNYIGLYPDNREVDIFIPSRNLAIELNGLYFHSEQFKERDYHRKKKEEIRSGVSLMMITDHQWKHKNEIVKSILRNKLGMSENRVFARKTNIEIHPHTTKEITYFFNDNHLDGFSGGNLYIILRDGREIVFGAIFGKSRFEKETDELIRLATRKNTIVVSGMSKILSEYRKLRKETRLVSYVNLDVYDGISYKRSWNLVENVGSGYFWTDGNEIISRQKARQKNEKEAMQSRGYYRYFDCGKLKFEMKE